MEREAVPLIVNPYSTNVTGTRIGRVEEALRESVDVWTRFTERPGHATELAAEGADAGVDAIAVFSGDGTYNEALNGPTAGSRSGSCPAAGRAVRPRARAAARPGRRRSTGRARRSQHGRARRISFGAVNGRRFCFAAGLGFDAKAVRRIDQLGRDGQGARPGDFTFGLAVARILFERRAALRVRPRDQGRRARGVPARRDGDPYSDAGRLPLRIAPHARFEDGIAFAAPAHVRPGDVPRLLTAAVRGRAFGQGVYTGVDLDQLEAVCDRPLPLHVDGEDLGDVEHAVFEARRDALDCLV